MVVDHLSTITLNDVNEDILHEKLAEVGIEVVHLERADPTLEDVFHSLAISGIPKGHNALQDD